MLDKKKEHLYYTENNLAGRKPLVYRTAGNFPAIFISVTGKEISGEGDLFSPAVYYRFPKDLKRKKVFPMSIIIGIDHGYYYHIGLVKRHYKSIADNVNDVLLCHIRNFIHHNTLIH